ncbi:MAG TPA: type II toxin-antitoxin system VapB family antitoxin [Acidimicrobiales bacterium]|nr:type II toxin-antitoxin system VapB family antitoxin [Acidimicrobiales bacterium]
MRTTLELDDALVASFTARLPGESKTEAIQRAVRLYLTHDAVDRLRQLAGTVEIEDLSGRLRASESRDGSGGHLGVGRVPAARQGIETGELDDLLVAGEVLVCGPVVAEVLAGAKSADRGRLWLLLTGSRWADLGPVQLQSAAETAARLRERGETVARSDIEIAIAAVGSSARLWTRDSDFQRIRVVLPALLCSSSIPDSSLGTCHP